MKTQHDRILAARMAVILDSAFFGSLLMRLQMVRDDSKQTFCTNGRAIKYNEAFCASLTDAQVRGVLVHEVMHCALGHLWRLDRRDPKRWNVATDYAINNFLNEFTEEESKRASAAGQAYYAPWELPADGLFAPQYSGLASEDIYNRLPQGGTRPPGAVEAGKGDGKGNVPGGQVPPGHVAPCAPSCGEFEQPDEDGEGKEAEGEGEGAPKESLEGDWAVAVTQAAAVEKMRGFLPASIARMVGELLEPKVPWRQVLREFIRQRTKDDYSWTHPNRRHLARGFILPSLHSERLGPIVFGVDTSGSIDGQTLNEFATEIQAAMDECKPARLEVIYCDAAVNGARTFEPGDVVKLEPMGGGGTRFAPVFEHIEKMDEPPVACIYLTDLHGSFPPQEPDYPVLWAWRDRHAGTPPGVPFGEVVAVR